MNLSTCGTSSPVSIYTTPEFRSQELAGGEFYFATIEDFEIAIDTHTKNDIKHILVQS